MQHAMTTRNFLMFRLRIEKSYSTSKIWNPNRFSELNDRNYSGELDCSVLLQRFDRADAFVQFGTLLAMDTLRLRSPGI